MKTKGSVLTLGLVGSFDNCIECKGRVGKIVQNCYKFQWKPCSNVQENVHEIVYGNDTKMSRNVIKMSKECFEIFQNVTGKI